MANLEALFDTEEIAKVFRKFKQKFSDGERVFTNVGFSSGSVDIEAIWHPDLSVWSYFDPEWRVKPDSYGCLFGIDDPKLKKTNFITLEINYNHTNPQKNTAGRFIKEDNEYFIGHSGKIGGGKQGIGKTAFLNYYNAGNLIPIQWKDGSIEDVIVIGALSDPTFAIKISKFVHQVASFKKQIVSLKNRNDLEKIEKRTASSDPIVPTFTPEFQGIKKYRRPESIVITATNHGLVVSSLKDELEQLGYSYANDPSGTLARDLFIPSKGNDAKILFEIKTDTSSTNIYTAIGQLMFHGAGQNEIPRRVLVIPEIPTEKTIEILKKLNIEIISYKMDDNGVSFPQFKEFLDKNENE